MAVKPVTESTVAQGSPFITNSETGITPGWERLLHTVTTRVCGRERDCYTLLPPGYGRRERLLHTVTTRVGREKRLLHTVTTRGREREREVHTVVHPWETPWWVLVTLLTHGRHPGGYISLFPHPWETPWWV